MLDDAARGPREIGELLLAQGRRCGSALLAPLSSRAAGRHADRHGGKIARSGSVGVRVREPPEVGERALGQPLVLVPAEGAEKAALVRRRRRCRRCEGKHNAQNFESRHRLER